MRFSGITDRFKGGGGAALPGAMKGFCRLEESKADAGYPTRPLPGRRKWLPVLAIAVVATLLLAGVGIVWYVRGQGARSGPEGPAITADALAVNGSVRTPAVGASVVVFSVVPSSMSDSNQTVQVPNGTALSNNRYYDELWAGTTDQSGTASGSLPPSFGALAAEWLPVVSAGTQTISMEVEGTYSVSTSAGVLVYHYYNNVGYSPFRLPTSFDVNVTFDLNHPVVSLPSASLLAPALMPAYPYQPPCNPTIVWTTLNTTSITGPYPLSVANDRAPSINDELLANQNSGSYNFQFAFNSAQASSSGTVVMSDVPSWTGTVSAPSEGYNYGALPTPGDSVGMGYINDVTLNVVNQKEVITNYYWDKLTDSCVPEPGGQSTLLFDTEKVANVQTSQFGYFTAFMDSYEGELLTRLASRSLAIDYSQPLSAHANILWNTLVANQTAYTGAGQALAAFEQAFSIFDASLAIGLAVMEMADVCSFFCSPVGVGTALSLVAAAAGFAVAVASMISSISYVVTTQVNIQSQTFTNDPLSGNGSAWQLVLLGAASSTQLDLSGNFYYPNMPGVVAYACPPGTTPGSGC